MTRLSTLFAAALFLAASVPAYAGQDWLSQEQVTKKITDSGYSHVTSLIPDEDHWQGKGLRNGRLMAFKADPRTGKILEEEPDRP